MLKYLSDFFERSEFEKYGANSLLVYALQLRYNIEDIDTVALESITDGYTDKKCDMIYIDENEKLAIVAQSYLKRDPKPREHAKLSKAQDLNTAASWVLGRDTNDLPEILKSSVSSLREALSNDKINTIYFWYVHNCDEFDDIKNELRTVETTAKSLIDTHFPGATIKVYGLEIGNETLEKWYENTTNKILVNDIIEIALPFGGYEIQGEQWSAYQSYISGKQLYDMYHKYNDDLFSANPRRFLGMGRKTNIINLGIKESAENEPLNFWAYNNGITALVHNYDCEDPLKLVITGISIINGAQTTGSIGSLKTPPNENLYVALRVIRCADKPTIERIIANNNRQNEMIPSDFRSNDVVQTRLRNEFSKYTQLYYNGGQRNSERPRSKEVFDPTTVGQTLLAFNGNPVDAYRSKYDVWDNDTIYTNVFNDSLSAEHIIFVYSLSKCIDEIKLELQQKVKSSELTEAEKNQLDFLSKRGSRILLLATVSKCLETLLQKPISSPGKLKFDNNNNFADCKSWWKNGIKSILSLYEQLLPALSAGGLDNKSKADESMKQVCALINAIIQSLSPQLEDLRTHTLLL